MTNDLDKIAGLPDELGIGADLARSDQRIAIRVDTRAYGKPTTVADGFDPKTVDLEDLASTLKRKLAVGGTVRDGTIEMQGKHGDRLRSILRDEGFTVEG